MGAIKVIKKIDTKNRVTVPSEWGVSGEFVFFEITKAGNLLIKKVRNEETEEETTLDENSNL